MLGVKFRRQCPVGPYILDFYSSDVKLCIELDGTVHDSLNAHSYDSDRTQYLNGLGITVLRFDNSIVFDCIDGVIESILHFINNPKGKPILTFPKGRNKLLLQITISPHLASPVGEGQIHLTG